MKPTQSCSKRLGREHKGTCLQCRHPMSGSQKLQPQRRNLLRRGVVRSPNQTNGPSHPKACAEPISWLKSIGLRWNATDSSLEPWEAACGWTHMAPPYEKLGMLLVTMGYFHVCGVCGGQWWRPTDVRLIWGLKIPLDWDEKHIITLAVTTVTGLSPQFRTADLCMNTGGQHWKHTWELATR